MTIKTKSAPYNIPKYSLTGDLLAFLKCRMQYRFYNKGSLPPSTPVQMWFGEFIHGVMEEAFRKWERGTFTIPCDAKSVHEICVSVSERLESKGLKPYSNIFVKDDEKCEIGLANRRAFQSLFVWGPHLFPLIKNNEVKLEDVRRMVGDPDTCRSDYYAVTGVADVITSIDLDKISPRNKVMQKLMADSDVSVLMDKHDKFEIIVDYKGAKRPDINDKEWEYHEWQLNTYMWLRRNQLISEGDESPVVAGVLLYLNELVPEKGYEDELIKSIKSGSTDVIPSSTDMRALENKIPTSDKYRRDRSFRLVPFDADRVDYSLGSFDRVVYDIESCVQSEIRDSSNVMHHWNGNDYQEERCKACDARYFCEDLKEKRVPPFVP